MDSHTASALTADRQAELTRDATNVREPHALPIARNTALLSASRFRA